MQNIKEYDIVIIGAGPAGSTLARKLAKTNYKVLIIDKRDLNKEKSNLSKSCGGLIAPDAQKTLAQFGLGIPKDVLVGPQLFTVRVIDFDNKVDRFYQRHYINVDREKFDRWLVDIIPDNIDRLFSTRLSSIEYKNDLYDINLKCNICRGDTPVLAHTIGLGATHPYSGGAAVDSIRIRAKIIIGADGANSKVRKFVSKNKVERYISIQEWYEVENAMPYFSSIFDKDITDFYSWTIPKDNYLILGSAIKEGDNVSKRFNLLKKKLINYGYNFDKRYKKEGAFIIRPQSLNQVYLGANNIFFIGEAAGLISPSSAEGISYALKSANFLANAIIKNKDNAMNLYKKDIRKLKFNIILKNLKSPFMYNKKIRNSVMKSKISSMDIKL